MVEEDKQKDKSPGMPSDNTNYDPDIHEVLNNLEYPSDASAATLNCSPGYLPDKNRSSSNTPAPRTPNEPGTDQSNATSNKTTTERRLIRNIAENASTHSHIEESDLSSISNAGGNTQMNIMGAYATAENETSVNRSHSIKQEPETSIRHPKGLKKSEEGAMFPKIQAPTVEMPVPMGSESPFEGTENITARKGLECDESLSLTPSQPSQTKDKKWTLTPNETSGLKSQKPENEHESGASPEFQSTYEGRKKTVSKAAKEEAKMNLDAQIQKNITDTECLLSEDFHKLKTDLSKAHIQITALTQENTELKQIVEAQNEDIVNLNTAFEEQLNRANQLDEDYALLEQHLSDPSKLDSLRGQALENAKADILQLRQHLKDRDKKLIELEKIVRNRDTAQKAEGTATFEEINKLCAEVQKYKILLSAAERTNQQLQNDLNSNLVELQNAQAQGESNNKELLTAVSKLEQEKKKLETSFSQCKTSLEKERQNTNSLSKNLEEYKEKYEKAFSELNEAKEEIEQLGSHKLSPDKAKYSEQLTQIRDQFNKKIQSLNDELVKTKEIISKKDAQIIEYEKKLQEDPMSDLVSEPTNNNMGGTTVLEQNTKPVKEIEELQMIRKLLEISEADNLNDKIEILLAESEECMMLRSQQKRMEEAYEELQKTNTELNVQLEQERKRWSEINAIEGIGNKGELEKKIMELQNNLDQVSKSKSAIQTQVNNLTELIKVKDSDIQTLKKSREVAENNEKSIKSQIEPLQKENSEKNTTLLNLVNEMCEFVKFSFIESKNPISDTMQDAEKLQKITDLIDYIQTLKENVELNYSANIKNIASLKENIANLEKTNTNLKNENAELLKKIQEFEKEQSNNSTGSLKSAENTELQKMRKMLNEERTHHTEVLEQMRVMHKSEVESASSSKQVKINQLEEKVKNLEEKLKRKKEKSLQKLNEAEEMLKKQENLLLENEKLRSETKKSEKTFIEKCAEIENLNTKITKLEEKYRKDKENYENAKQNLQQKILDFEGKITEKDKQISELEQRISEMPEKQEAHSFIMQTEENINEKAEKLNRENTELIQNMEKLKKESEEISQKLEISEKNNKITQQRLLQAYEENNEKINSLTEKLQKSREQSKNLENENNGLNAECKRIQQLLEEAKADMKKMLNTNKKMNSVRSSLAEPVSTLTLSSGNPIKNDQETEKLIQNYEDEIQKLKSTLDQNNPQEIFNIFDSLISEFLEKSGNFLSPPTSKIASELFARIEKIRSLIEQKYTKELEELQKQVNSFMQVQAPKSLKSSGAIPKSLQASIEHLKESLSETEKASEENIQKRILAERRKIKEEIKRTLSMDEGSRKSMQTAESQKGKIISPARMSGCEQQYKTELDALNNDDICCATGRTVSFGIPEYENENEENGINEIVEECKKKFEQQKNDEFEKLMQNQIKQYEEKLSKLQTSHKLELEKTLSEYEKIKSGLTTEINSLKKQLETNKNQYCNEIENLKQNHKCEIEKISSEKEQQMDDLLKIKTKEITANLSTEQMKLVNEKKEELTKQYMENKENLVKEFEQLKLKLYSEIELKTQKIETEYQGMIEENEKLKKESEAKFNERMEEKEKLLENIMKMRTKEIEDEYRIKAEKLEYNLKYEAQCQTERQRAELTGEQREIEEKYRSRIDDLENKLRTSSSDFRKQKDELESEIRNLKEENDKKCEQIKKKIEKELNGKNEQLQKKIKDFEEKTLKAKKEYEELLKKYEDEKETMTNEISKKFKDEIKTLKEKHKSEIRNLKESSKNELIKKNIEKEREIKKLSEAHAAEIEQINKQAESRKEIIIKPQEKNFEDKKDSEKMLQNKINALRKKLESEYQEKEKSLKADYEKKAKDTLESTQQKLEKTLNSKFEQKYSQLKEEVDKLKVKYQTKKKKLEELRIEYETRLRSEMKENKMRESNNSVNSAFKKPMGNQDTTLSEIDYEGIAKENEEKIKIETERKRIIEEYELKLNKIQDELQIATTRRDNTVRNSLQTFVEILLLELDKLLKITNGNKQDSIISIAEINKTIAKMILNLTPDGKCREFLESFKVKLNSVVFAFKQALEEKFKQKAIGTASAEKENSDSKFEDYKGIHDNTNSMGDSKKYFEVMDAEYEKNILTKISPIRNNNGKYVVDVEKVVRDLLLVKEALYSVFQKSTSFIENKSLEGTSCTILEELGKATTESIPQENIIDNISKHYRILLNTILRFAVEAAWVVKEEAKTGGKKKATDMENEEMLRLKLTNAELCEKLADAEQELCEKNKKLALFTGQEVQAV